MWVFSQPFLIYHLTREQRWLTGQGTRHPLMWPGLESRGRPTDVGWVSCSFSSILLQAFRMVQNGWSREKKCLAPYLPPPFHFFVCCPDNILSLAYWLVFFLLRRPFFYQLIDWLIFIFPGIRVSPTFPNANSMNSEMVEKEPFCAVTTNKSLFTCVSIYDIFIFYIL